MVSVVLNGALGKMGLECANVAKISSDVKIVAGVDVGVEKIDLKEHNFGFEIFNSIFDLDSGFNFDVIVDFSHPDALDSILEFAQKTKTAVVLATTGYTAEQVDKIKKFSETIPIFFTFNMSIGINLMVSLAKKAYEVLGDCFDVEIVEKHHNQKIDAPSGTALMLADAINSAANGKFSYVYERQSKTKKRDSNEIGIHSVRGGTIVGEHEIIFAGCDEMVKLSHIATSKRIFAQGALRAAVFIKNKTAGLFDMNDLIR